MSFNARREALIIELTYQSWQANKEKRSKLEEKSCPWPHCPSAILTASRDLWRISAPSRLGIRLVLSHHHPGAKRPRSETDQLEEQWRVRHCSSELHMKLCCLYSRKDHVLIKWSSLLPVLNVSSWYSCSEFYIAIYSIRKLHYFGIRLSYNWSQTL